MEYAFTLNVLPVVGGVVIVLVLVLCELGSTGFGGGLPSGGYRYYIGEHTVLYLRQSGKRCRAYVLEGEAPPAVPLHHSRGGTYFKGVGGLSGRGRAGDRTGLSAAAGA